MNSKSKSKINDEELIKQLDTLIAYHMHRPDFDFYSIINEANISVSRLYSLIKRWYQDTPAQHLLKRRLDKAKELLDSTSLSVHEIILQTGFHDQDYFITTFKARFGKQPDAH